MQKAGVEAKLDMDDCADNDTDSWRVWGGNSGI